MFIQKLSSYQVHKLVSGVSCFVVFTILAKSHYDGYAEEQTGTALRWLSIKDLPFPAVSICDPHFEQARAYKELPIALGIFGRPPKNITKDPEDFYLKLESFGHDIMPNLWEYYFKLDGIFTGNEEPVNPLQSQCRIGTKSCGAHLSATTPRGSNEIITIDVEAGTWTSKFIADSKDGVNYLCHTLVPNVTVDFTVAGGNSFAFRWETFYKQYSPFWFIYVHDRNEHVLLDSHAIESLPSITISYANSEAKAKAKIMPKLHELPEPSELLPCETADDYSTNLCNLKWGWRQRFQTVKQRYGENFTCQLPGIWVDPDLQMPVCDTYYPKVNNSTGLRGLLRDLVSRHRGYLLAEPPIGIYKDSSGCRSRCNSYTYHLIEETVSVYDTDMGSSDIYIYFASTTVETWREYRLHSVIDFLAGLGGSMGLMLGLSVFSIFVVLVDGLKSVFAILQPSRKSKTVRVKRPPKKVTGSVSTKSTR